MEAPCQLGRPESCHPVTGDPFMEGEMVFGVVRAPEFPEGLDWINTGGGLLRLAALRGKVVLLDFWTYG